MDYFGTPVSQAQLQQRGPFDLILTGAP